MQQRGSKYFACRPHPLTLGVRSKGQNSTFSEHCHAAYQIKWNHKCSNIVGNILPADPLPPNLGVKGQNLTFSEHGHVVYQIKMNHERSNMADNPIPADPRTPPPPPRRYGFKSSKFNFFRTWSCCTFN